MDPRWREPFNKAYSAEVFHRYAQLLERRLRPFPFRLAETPLFLTRALRESLAQSAMEIVGQLKTPANLAAMRGAVPARYDVPGMDELPNCVQVDFALVRDPDTGEVSGRVVELQGFPSLYVLQSAEADAWADVLNDLPGMRAPWTCFYADRASSIETMKSTILGGCAPEEVALVDFEPEQQKTSPDFVATKLLTGVDAVCVTQLKKRGRKLYRDVGGREVQVKRIFNRMVFDELEAKRVTVPFAWNDDLDVTWCSHPNWYWAWSKYSLPYLSHPAVPVARFLSDVRDLPQDLDAYVLKPLFSFAGSGVVVDVTNDAITRIPEAERRGWILQKKVVYAPVIPMPDGVSGVKAEVRVMLMRPPHAKDLAPLLCLVRLSRGKMLGVDYNKDLTWVGGSVGLWGD